MSILQHTEISEPQFGKALVDKVNRRVNVQRDGRLSNQESVSSEWINFRDGYTYRINESGKVHLGRIFSLTVVNSDRGIHRHQTDCVLLIVTKGIEREFEIWRGNKASQDAISKDWQAAVQLAGHQKVLKLCA